MKVRMNAVKPLRFTEDEHALTVQYSNRGEPFRDGVEFAFTSDDMSIHAIWVLLDRHDVAQLRDKLNEFLEASK